MGETRAIARLPHLEIEIRHRRLPEEQAEQLAISLRATPSFAAFAEFLERQGAVALAGAAAMAALCPDGPGQLAALARRPRGRIGARATNDLARAARSQLRRRSGRPLQAIRRSQSVRRVRLRGLARSRSR